MSYLSGTNIYLRAIEPEDFHFSIFEVSETSVFFR